MGDPNRIDKIQNKITELWKYYPDMGYFQFISWLHDLICKDTIYLEDDAIELLINDLIRIARAREALKEVNKEMN